MCVLRCALAWAVGVSLCLALPAEQTQPEEAKWVGRPSAELRRELGSPLARKADGDQSLWFYPDTLIVTVKGNSVVAVRHATAPEVSQVFGIRYESNPLTPEEKTEEKKPEPEQGAAAPGMYGSGSAALGSGESGAAVAQEGESGGWGEPNPSAPASTAAAAEAGLPGDSAGPWVGDGSSANRAGMPSENSGNGAEPQPSGASLSAASSPDALRGSSRSAVAETAVGAGALREPAAEVFWWWVLAGASALSALAMAGLAVFWRRWSWFSWAALLLADLALRLLWRSACGVEPWALAAEWFGATWLWGSGLRWLCRGPNLLRWLGPAAVLQAVLTLAVLLGRGGFQP